MSGAPALEPAAGAVAPTALAHEASQPVVGESASDESAPQTRPRSSPATLVLAALAIAVFLWAAQGLILPILLAAFFALIGNPLLRATRRLRLPRFIGALLVLLLGLAGAVFLGWQLAAPAADWFAQAPRTLQTIGPKLRKMVEPVQQANRAAEDIARVAGGENPRRPVQVVRTEQNDPYRALTTTPKLLASVLAVVLLTFFFMVYGDNLQRGAIGLLRERQRKVLTTDILQSIEREMSRYVLTISVINALLGLAVAAMLHWVIGFDPEQALLWGTATALLNFAPYVGPFIGFALLLLAGLVKFDSLGASVLPAALYLAIQTVEGQIITPIVLGRRMALSPLVVILALMVFSWAWGMVGLLLAIPLLVCVKIVLSKVDGLQGWARLLE